MTKYKPGPGWYRIGDGVYEHTNGARIHMLLMIRLPRKDGGYDFLSSRMSKNAMSIKRCIKINGGNVKRGLMAAATSMMEHRESADINQFLAIGSRR